MKNKTLLTCVATTLLYPAICFSGPAVRADIPADPAWVLHLDVDAVRPTTLGAFLLEQLQKPEANDKLGAFQAMFNFDPRTALHGISLYSTTQRTEDGVLIVYADCDPERLTTLVKGAKDYKDAKHRSHTIHSWIDEKRKGKNGEKPRAYGAIAGKRVVLGQKQESVAAALDVMDGIGGSLTSSQAFQQLGAPTQGMFLQAAGRNLRPPGSNPNAALLKLSDHVRVELGEKQGQVNGLVTLQARDEEVAGHLNSVAQGMISLMKLQTEKPAQARFAETVQLKQQGTEVIGTMSLPASEVVGALNKFIARKKAAAGEQ